MGRKLPKIVEQGTGAYDRATCPRGFHVEADPRDSELRFQPKEQCTLFVRNGYRAVVCTGEAHLNLHIDNCMRCAPMWGVAAEEIRS